MAPDFFGDSYPRKRQKYVTHTVETCRGCGRLATHEVMAVQTQESEDSEWRQQQLHKECTECWMLNPCDPEDYEEGLQRLEEGETFEEVLADPVGTAEDADGFLNRDNRIEGDYNVASGSYAGRLVSIMKWGRKEREGIWIFTAMALLALVPLAWRFVSRSGWPGALVAVVAFFLALWRLTGVRRIQREIVPRIENFTEKMNVPFSEMQQALERTPGGWRILPYLHFRRTSIEVIKRIALPLFLGGLGIVFLFAERPLRAEIAWRWACERNTAAAYKEFSYEFYDSPYALEADMRAMEIEDPEKAKRYRAAMED
jgi:hypothetical protein